MTLYTALIATVEISQVMIPPIVIGFFLANVIRRSPYFRYLTMPTAWLAAIARLPAECSAALTLFLVNSWAALALLSEAHKNRQINDRELIVAVLVGFIPKGLNSMLIFSLPVALSVLGPHTGGLYVCFDLLANFFVAGIGILAARMMLAPRESMTTKGDETTSAGDWKVILREGLHECISSSIKITRVLVPTIFLAQLAIEYVLVLLIVERYNAAIEPLGFSSSSLIVLMASVVSQSAALVASGTLLKEGSLNTVSCLILLFMARFLHLGIGCFRIGIPANVSYFRGSLGLRVTAIEYSLVEVANILMILMIFLFL
ncbi:MAG: hypothetical protein M0Q47_12235 [Methanothrix sp.]|jgi:hypothetical protein|uniref:hypothetical protein n=1 Tax=Methanothrix sp. TaxID=90426 RepID=UPI0025EBF8ED|nr:hypothetical protein [Methanothrix sp.]MCK9407162.1 hypothetical protein [Methanothrix sp.]